MPTIPEEHRGIAGLSRRSVARTESERAIDLAYKAVARRELTVAELRTRLERKRVPPEAIDDAVEELEATGFLDDARYARQFTEDKRELDQWGSERIARDLHRRGIARHLIEEIVSTRSRDSELRTAVLLLEQRHPSAPDGRPRARPRLADAGAPRLHAGDRLRRDPGVRASSAASAAAPLARRRRLPRADGLAPSASAAGRREIPSVKAAGMAAVRQKTSKSPDLPSERSDPIHDAARGGAFGRVHSAHRRGAPGRALVPRRRLVSRGPAPHRSTN